METPKEAAIRKAWIAEIGEEKYNEVKDKIEYYGFIYYNFIGVNYLSDTRFENNERFLRPLSLKGIEHNNGWNSMKETGLPSEEGEYIILTIDGKIRYGGFDKYDVANLHNLKTITHWRKKEPYPDPIY